MTVPQPASASHLSRVRARDLDSGYLEVLLREAKGDPQQAWELWAALEAEREVKERADDDGEIAD